MREVALDGSRGGIHVYDGGETVVALRWVNALYSERVRGVETFRC